MALDLTDLRQPPTVQPMYDNSTTPISNAQQIKAMNEYAALLAKNSQMPVQHWSQGVSNMVNALVGGMVDNRAAQLQNMGIKHGQTEYSNQIPSAPKPMPDASGDAPSDKRSALPEGASNYASKEGSDLLDRAAKATSKQESGGRYDNVTTTNNVKTGVPQSALGKYGVMDFNVGPWTKEVLGKEMTPEEFLADKGAQDAVYRGKMGQYIAKYGPEGAGRAWLGGDGGVDHPNRRDALGTTVDSYGKNFVKALGQGTSAEGGTAMAFNGQPAAPGGDAARAITMALAKGTPAAAPPSGAPAGVHVAQAPVGPFSNPIDVPKGILPPASTYTKGQIGNLAVNPFINEKLHDNALSLYMNTQVNPQSIPTTGGKIIVPPGGGKGYFVPDLQKGTEKVPGGGEYPTYETIGPDLKVRRLEDGSTPSAPGTTSAPVGAPPPPLPPRTPITPAEPAEAPGKSGALELPAPPSNILAYNDGGPVSDAATPVSQAVAAAAAKGAPLAAPAETGSQAIDKAQAAIMPAGIPGAGPAAASPMGDKMAAVLNAPPPVSPPGVQVAETNQERRNRLMDEGIEYKRRESLAADDAKAYTKNVQDYAQIGTSSLNNLPLLKSALELTNDKRYYSGLFNDPWEILQKGKAGLAEFGFGGDKAAAAPMEIFQKILSGSIVQALKTQLGGLGQIRLAEIDLITKSVANKYNTPAANRAVLQLMIATGEQAHNVGTIATQYDKGWVLDPKGNWTRRQGPPTNAGLHEAVDNYTKANPLLTDDQIKDIGNTFAIADKTAKPNAAVPYEKTKAEFIKAAGLGMTAKDAQEPAASAGPAADPLGIR